MGFLRYLLPVVASLTMTVSAFAAGDSNAIGERDLSTLRDYLNEKRLVTVNEKGGDLTISGDVRARWNNREQTNDGVAVTGSRTPNESSYFTGEANLMFDYRAERAWSSTKVRFKNQLGVVDGSDDGIDLKRAYVGYNVWQDGPARVDVEVGRMQMSDIFDSEIQFDSVYDGILAGYRTQFEDIGDFFIHGGGFVIDNLLSNFGWVGEVGLTEILDTGLYVKYSYIQWSTGGLGRFVDNVEEATDTPNLTGPPSGAVTNNPALRFNNSQLLVGYVFDPAVVYVPLKAYGAFLLNTDAIGTAVTRNEKENQAWYVGLTFGKLEKAGDWSFDAQYQYVQAQAVPSFDVAGIGRGPVNKNINTPGTTPEDAKGAANYKGVQLTAYVNLTDNLTMKGMWQESVAENQRIGRSNKYHNFELGVIYNW